MRLSAVILFAFFATQLGALPADDDPLRVSFPDQNWAVQILAPGFVVTQNETHQDGRRYLAAQNDASGIEVSVTIEKVSKPATLEGCQEEFETRLEPGGPFRLTGVKQSRSGEMAVLEYVIPDFNHVQIDQKNIFGCFGKDQMYVDVHVSKDRFKDADEAQLMAVLSTTKVVNADAPGAANTLPQGSAAFFADGTRHYQLQEYDRAVEPYKKALELEKQERKLDPLKWHLLVGNLAVSYGIMGDLDEGQKLLAYGLSQDPTYPMFYFVLADNFAERDDLPNTIKNLKLALQYKSNAIPGQKLPSPLSDDSFKRFWGNPEFMNLADEF